MPFDLSNAHATFQGLMKQVFRDCLRKFALMFFDDVLVHSATLVGSCSTPTSGPLFAP